LLAADVTAGGGRKYALEYAAYGFGGAGCAFGYDGKRAVVAAALDGGGYAAGLLDDAVDDAPVGLAVDEEAAARALEAEAAEAAAAWWYAAAAAELYGYLNEA